MILYIDLEHPRLFEVDPPLAQAVAAKRLRAKYRFETMAQDTCLIVRYDRFEPAMVATLKPWAIVVSGNNTDHKHYDAVSIERLRALFTEVPCPIFGICGSFQLMAETWGVPIGPIGKSESNEAIQAPDVAFAGYLHENGFCTVDAENDHPLFAGLPTQLTFRQNHYWEVKTVPESFQRLASSATCAIQALAHTKLPLMGCQFHPEEYTDAYPDGKTLLKNFFKLAKDQL